jgi:peptidoglycan/xylan/chitin deacetylase (PgdA/CDA1 family)
MLPEVKSFDGATTGDGAALRFARTLLGERANHLSPSVLSGIEHRLLRVEELEDDTRDEFGNWEPATAARARYAVPHTDLALELHHRLAPPAPAQTLWPEGRRFAACITHDVDGVSDKNHARRFIRRARRVFGQHRPRSVPLKMAAGSLVRLAQRAGRTDGLGCFERWIEVEANLGARSTWFFLPGHYSQPHPYDIDYEYDDRVTYAGRRMSVGTMIRTLAESGAEIGLHGSYLSSEDPEMLSEQRRQLQHVSGTSVTSIRQHYLRYDVRRTPAAHAAAGFLADSTVGFNETSGFRAGTSFPYFPFDHTTGQVSSVVELPMVLMDGHLRSLGLDAEGAIRHCGELIDAVENVGGCLTLNWHPNHIHNPLFWRTFCWVLEECGRRGAWFGTVEQIASRWRDMSVSPRAEPIGSPES